MNKEQIEKLYTKKDKFILDENKNVIPATLLEWGEFLETHHKEKIVKQEYVEDKWISTVFLGLNHNWCPNGIPLIFETMVFDNKGKDRREIYCTRYPAWIAAEEGHEIAVQWVKDGCKDDE